MQTFACAMCGKFCGMQSRFEPKKGGLCHL